MLDRIAIWLQTKALEFSVWFGIESQHHQHMKENEERAKGIGGGGRNASP